MSKKLSEKDVLKKLDIQDFRDITKDKVMGFVSILPNMDTEVAKKAIEQFPEFIKFSTEAFKDYRGVLEKTLNANEESSKACFDMYEKVLSILEKCSLKEDISFEEKKYYFDKMFEIIQMVEKKDSENKAFYQKLLNAGATVLVAIVGIGAAAIGVKSDINLPRPKI
jgi:hypothetical protein